MYFGDVIETVLEKVGIDHQRVSEWVGGECGCKERRDRLNALDRWARQFLYKESSQAVEYLRRLMQ